MKLRIFAMTIAAVLLAAGGCLLLGQGTRARATQTPALSPMSLKSALPSATTAKTLLQSTPRHREWVGVPVGSGIVLAFVVYPERSDKAPVVVVTAKNQGASVWVRAVSDQVAAEGFIAVAPEVLTGLGPKGGDSESFRTPDEVIHALGRMGSEEIARRINAVREYAVSLPSANGVSASLELDGGDAQINVVMHSSGAEEGTLRSTLTGAGWREALAYLNEKSENRPVFGTNLLAPENEHAEHMAMMMQAAHGERASSGGSQGVAESLAVKRPDLPANYYTARSTLAHSKLRKEWVDIPVGDVKLHTWIEYPQGNGKAGVVVVMQYGTGMDEWIEAVADQLAQEGFIAIAPDTWSGTGLNGGGRDTFQFVDDAMKAGARITPDETQRRFKAARDYAMKLPRANGKSGSIGFCAGGGNSFRFAGEVPELNAAVVFYGTPPSEEIMARIKAPVLGFYGENDARVTATVEPAIAAMKRLGKSYEPHIYPKTTHSFVYFQDAGTNAEAVADAWPRAIAFLKQNLK
jgi:carboxymethylenebutenolidase